MAHLSPPASLTDGVVAIRSWQNSDLPELVQLVEDPEIARWTGIPAPYTRKEAKVFFKTNARQEAMGVGTDSAIVDAVGGELMGGVGLKLHPAHANAEVGYWVAANARRRGIATRAVCLMARWAFGELEVKRLELLTNIGNEASEGVALKCGFQREGVLRSARLIKGERVDLTLFSLLPEELMPV
ncbi:MAG: GNAT family N-acetyltransferase [Actinomycetota bacterium]